jgi:hypothetical protein
METHPAGKVCLFRFSFVIISLDGNDKRDAGSWGLTRFNLTLKFEIWVVDALVAAVVPEELPKEQAAPPPSKKGRGRRQ